MALTRSIQAKEPGRVRAWQDWASWVTRSSSPHPTRPTKSSAKVPDVPEARTHCARGVITWTSNVLISTRNNLLSSVLLYGPGRYDSSREEGGNDYPLPYVRWTENGTLKPSCMPEHGTLMVDCSSPSASPSRTTPRRTTTSVRETASPPCWFTTQKGPGGRPDGPHDRAEDYNPGEPVLGVIGAGNFTGSTILPKLNKAGAQIQTIASAKGLSGASRRPRH